MEQVSFNTFNKKKLLKKVAHILGSFGVIFLIVISGNAQNITLSSPGQVAADNAYQGSTRYPLYSFQLDVTGSASTLNAITFATTGTYAAADITKFYLLFSSTNTFPNSMQGATQIGTNITTGLGVGNHTLSAIGKSIPAGTSGYIWIVADLAVGAGVGNTIAVSALTTASLTFSAGSKSGTTSGGSTQTIVSGASSSFTATALTGFGYVCLSKVAGPRTFTISGSNLNHSQPIILGSTTAGPIAGMTFSTDGVTYVPAPITLTPSGGAYSQDIFVKFTPTAVQNYATAANSIRLFRSGVLTTSVTIPATTSGVNYMPTLSTGSAAGITDAEALLGGSISDTGCTAVTSYGVEYSTTSGFANGTGTQVPASNISGGGNGGNFSAAISGLASGTNYCYHTYATNSAGTAYGPEVCFATDVSLPVHLLYFIAYPKENYHVLEWSTQEEQDNERFEIERSYDGLHFTSIGSVPGKDFSASQLMYEYKDYSATDQNSVYYRLKQIDHNGKYSYSSIVKISNDSYTEVIIYPVPASDVLYIDWMSDIIFEKSILYNQYGVAVDQMKIDNGSNHLVVNLKNIPSGIYFVELFSITQVVRKRVVIE